MRQWSSHRIRGQPPRRSWIQTNTHQQWLRQGLQAIRSAADKLSSCPRLSGSCPASRLPPIAAFTGVDDRRLRRVMWRPAWAATCLRESSHFTSNADSAVRVQIVNKADDRRRWTDDGLRARGSGALMTVASASFTSSAAPASSLSPEQRSCVPAPPSGSDNPRPGRARHCLHRRGDDPLQRCAPYRC